MKFVFVCISFLTISTLLYAKEKNPFELSNIQVIEINMQYFLGELDIVRNKLKEEVKKKQLELQIHIAEQAKKKQKELEAKYLEEIKIAAKATKLLEEIKRKEALQRNIHKKIIYLTFDDGPLLGTANVLQVLHEEGIEATMFFVGDHIKMNKSLFKKALAMSNLCISNHTYSHANEKYAHFYSNMNRVVKDVDRSQKMIGGAKYLRLAGRNIWRLPTVYKNDYAISKKQRKIEIPKYDALMDNGYQIYGWDIEWKFNHHTGNPSYGVDTIVKKIERKYARGKMTKKGKMILLAHDYMFRGKKGILILRALIHKLKEKDWKFKTLDEYTSTLI
jgi:peptidoglycan/xylan/chitin deacetylase (PgdA/CDA1 family)